MKAIIDEYPPEYCHSLEAVYGSGMMSEGGGRAIDSMFKGLNIANKKALDIGSGLGGVAYYLSEEYEMDITGLEINPWMVEEATRRTPEEIKDRVRFLTSVDNSSLPFEDGSFDIVYSKGVLCHVDEKQGLFEECYRILKPGSVLVINDWLSPTKEKWGAHVQRLIELEGLSLYAETVEHYVRLLREANFKDIEIVDLSKQYAAYNEDIARQLKTPEKKESFIRSFNEQLHEEAIDGYESIAKAMRLGEVLVIKFTAHKQ